MTPTEAHRLIKLAWSQWPKLEPDPDAVIIWTAGLAKYDYDQAAHAVVEATVNATTPPSVADVIAVLDPTDQTDWAEAWVAVTALIRAGRFSHRLNPDEFPNQRAFNAAKSIQFQLRTASTSAAKWIFRDAYNATAASDDATTPRLEPAEDPQPAIEQPATARMTAEDLAAQVRNARAKTVAP